MFSQDQRQQMPGGVPMQPQGQVQHLGGQMAQIPMQIGSQQQQQPMSGIAPNIPPQNPGMQRTIATMQPQHSATGVQQQLGLGGGVRPIGGGNPQQANIATVVKSENLGQSPQVPIQRMAAPNQPQSHPQEGQNAQSQTAHQDRIVRFKLLLPQLKECLINLISIARQNFVANATIDNVEKTIDTSLIPRFDKALEQFYSICNQIEMNLMLASDQISHTIFSMQYTPLTANQMKDSATNPQVFTSYINIVKQQLAYAKEIQNMLTESSDKILARQRQLPQQQQHSRGPSQF